MILIVFVVLLVLEVVGPCALALLLMPATVLVVKEILVGRRDLPRHILHPLLVHRPRHKLSGSWRAGWVVVRSSRRIFSISVLRFVVEVSAR